jgi:glucoamylase
VTKFRGERAAFGRPGLPAWWTQGNKDGVGTAYSPSSRVWFTLHDGILTEVFYPTVDRPQLRDLQYLISDGATFLAGERQLKTHLERLSDHALGYRVVKEDPEGRYRLVKEIITDPHLPCVLQRTRLEADPRLRSRLQLYALCSPHLAGAGRHNNGYVIEASGREMLVAERNGVWLAMAATVPFSKLSCGYVGRSDGWTDLAENFRLDWEFDRAEDGNIGLTGEFALPADGEFTLGLAFGDGLHSAVTTLLQSLGTPFSHQRQRYQDQWHRPVEKILPLSRGATDGGSLYHASVSLLLAHEDKSFPGALIASLSIPWGEAKGDGETGGYHFVWTRDMVNSAMGLLAAGNTATPLRALIYLAASQQPDGGFPQNFWINGQPHWFGVQLDEVAFPILLAWRLWQKLALQDFDPYTMVMRAARFLILNGPATQQERWEENAGYSPSTLAVSMAALICAAQLARDRGDGVTAGYLEEYADFLECHIEPWTVTSQGVLLPDVPRHFIRIHPVDLSDPHAPEEPNHGRIAVANQPPGVDPAHPAKAIIDAGFLELVRYGIRRPEDPLVLDSLRVADAMLRVETPFGPCWRRYNHDGYGQRPDGGPYVSWGQGRAWPLLTGERAHYELAAGRDVTGFIRAMERFASSAGILAEQVWDEADRPQHGLYCGRPTGAAAPLMWAHAEYIKLLRSVCDGRIFDLIAPVGERYLGTRARVRRMEVWKANRQPRTVAPGTMLRVQAAQPFRLRWTADEWRAVNDTESRATALGIHFVDLPACLWQKAPFRFTFFWTGEGRWEGQDYLVAMEPGS